MFKRLEPEWYDSPAAVRGMTALHPDDIGEVCAALALPLHSQGKALGVLEFFHTSPYPRDDELLQLTTFIALHIAGYLDQLRGTDLLERSSSVTRKRAVRGWT